MQNTASADINLGGMRVEEFVRTVWRRRPLHLHRFIADFPPDYLDIRRMGQLLDSSRHVIFRPGDIPQATPSDRELERRPMADTLEKHLTADNVHFSIYKAEKEDPVIGEFAERLLTQLREAFRPHDGELLDSAVILFMASPNAVTKYHADPSNGFLFQLWGSKTVYTYPEYDSEVFPDNDKERFAMNATANQPKFYDKCKLVEQRFEVRPGDTLYIPAMWPHWVLNGPEPSCSLSMQLTFEADSARFQVLKLNYRLRRMGWQPKSYGRSRPLDGFKTRVMSLYERIHGYLPRHANERI